MNSLRMENFKSKEKTKLKRILTLLIAVLMLMSFSACGNKGGYDFGPVSGGASASDSVTGNGNMVVQKGNYLYFINGYGDRTSKAAFGDVIRGALVRSDLDGSNVVTIVPRVVVNSYAKGGIYIFGDSVYYTSPNDEKNSSGEVQTSYQDFMVTKLDGTGTKKLLTTANSTYAYRFYEVGGDVYLVYTASNGAICSLNCTKPAGVKVLASSFSGSAVYADECVFYTRSVYIDKDKGITETYNEVYAVVPNAAEVGTKADTEDYVDYGTKLFDGLTTVGDSKIKFMYTLKNIVDGRLFYTKVDSKATKTDALCSVSVSGTTLGTEIVHSYNSANVTGYLPYVYDGDKVGLIALYGGETVFLPQFVQNAEGDLDNLDERVYLASTELVMIAVRDGYLYYSATGTTGHNLYRMEIENAIKTGDDYQAGEKLLFNPAVEAEEEGEKDVAEFYDEFRVNWLDPVFLDGKFFYLRATGDYASYVFAYDFETEETVRYAIVDADDEPDAE